MAAKRSPKRRTRGKSFVVAILPGAVEMAGKRRRALDPKVRFAGRRKPPMRATGTLVSRRPRSGPA
jgi:hypothetical protein